MTLTELKECRIIEIDNRTQELIMAGFVFDGHTFSMSLTAQINWSNFLNVPDQLFPLQVIDKNDLPYVCELSNKINFYYAALTHKNTQLQSGGALKVQINACQTEQEVHQIIDNR